MRGLALGAAGAIFFLSAVNAADIYGECASCSWTGFYIGVNGGYGQADRTVSFTHNNVNGQAITCPEASGSPCPAPVSVKIGGGLGGLQGGYNWQIGNWLAGFETDLDWSGAHGKEASSFMLGPAPANLQVSEDLDWFGTLRARIGSKLAYNLLPYVTAGLAYGGVRDNGAAGAATVGWTAGTGLEYSFWGNLSLKMEYLYVDLGSGHALNAVAQTGGGTALPASFTAAADENDFHIFRFGLNYQFRESYEQLK